MVKQTIRNVYKLTKPTKTKDCLHISKLTKLMYYAYILQLRCLYAATNLIFNKFFRAFPF